MNQRLLILISTLFINSSFASVCEKDVDGLIKRLANKDVSIQKYIGDNFHITDLILDNEQKTVGRTLITLAEALEEDERLFPSKHDMENGAARYELGPSFRKNFRYLKEINEHGGISSNFRFWKKDECWIYGSKVRLTPASEKDLLKYQREQDRLRSEMRATPNFSTIIDHEPISTPIGKTQSTLTSLHEALYQFRVHTGRYPSLKENIKILVGESELEKPTGYVPGGYLNSKALNAHDAWGNKYSYSTSPCSHFLSFGEDGKAGGSGLNQDIGGCIVP